MAQVSSPARASTGWRLGMRKPRQCCGGAISWHSGHLFCASLLLNSTQDLELRKDNPALEWSFRTCHTTCQPNDFQRSGVGFEWEAIEMRRAPFSLIPKALSLSVGQHISYRSISVGKHPVPRMSKCITLAAIGTSQRQKGGRRDVLRRPLGETTASAWPPGDVQSPHRRLPA